MARSVDPGCAAFQTAIAVLGRPWTALILGLLQDGPLRFGELEREARGVGTKVLSRRLKDLEARGLIVRRVEAGPPVRVRYALTGTGEGFGEVAGAIQRWGSALVEARPRARGAGRPRGAAAAPARRPRR